MNNLRLSVTVASLSSLTLIGTNTYSLFVEVFDLAGDPLDNPNIPNSYTATVVTTTTSFFVNIPITDGNYFIPSVVFKLYDSADTSCCFATRTENINNTSEGGDDLELSFYINQ